VFRVASSGSWEGAGRSEAPIAANASISAASNDHAVVTRLRACGVAAVVASVIFALLVYTQVNVSLDPGGTYVLGWILAALMLVSRMWWNRAGHHRIADALGTVAIAALGGMACGALAMLTLPLHFPLADGMFHRMDHAIGVDTIDLATQMARLGPDVFTITWPAYDYTLQIFFGSLLALSFLGDRVEAWRASACFVATLLTVCLVATFLPAKGAGLWGTKAFFALLPDSAMRGFWAHFDEFYQGAAPVLQMRAIDGVISFPSFHTIVGLLVVAMWRTRPVMRSVALLWFACMMPGTLFYGGHYVVDLIGGAAIWAIWFIVTRRVESFPREWNWKPIWRPSLSASS
jgi:membrane-associated phospholipid phosphatase